MFRRVLIVLVLTWLFPSLPASASLPQPRTPQELAALWAGTCGSHAPTIEIPPGAAYLTPGRYMDTRRAGQGWDFFWYSDASPTPDDPQDLFVVFYTYRKEPSGWRPVWYGARGQVVFDSVTNPTQRLGFVGELVKLKQFPVAPEADPRGTGRTFANGEVVGEVSLAFTALGMNGNPNKAAVHWKINRDELNAAYPDTTGTIGPGQSGDVVRSCLDNFGGLASPATTGTRMDAARQRAPDICAEAERYSETTRGHPRSS